MTSPAVRRRVRAAVAYAAVLAVLLWWIYPPPPAPPHPIKQFPDSASCPTGETQAGGKLWPHHEEHQHLKRWGTGQAAAETVVM